MTNIFAAATTVAATATRSLSSAALSCYVENGTAENRQPDEDASRTWSATGVNRSRPEMIIYNDPFNSRVTRMRIRACTKWIPLSL